LQSVTDHRGPYLPRHTSLSDGTRLTVRALRRDDGDLLARGFAELGPESRYYRFFATKSLLTERDLRELTDLDGEWKCALGAVCVDPTGAETLLGVARFVRSRASPSLAEPAIAVIDSKQGKGLGTLLLRELSARAYQLGVRRFRCPVLAANAGMHRLLHELDEHVHVLDRSSGVEQLELDVPPPGAPPEHDEPREKLSQLLRLAADAKVSLRPSSAPDLAASSR
jgi:GNAT superfamily N-acetyltransferase